MLTIVDAVAVGMLIGELVAGIPLSRRIARYERRKPTQFPDVGDLGGTIIAEWPDDRAAAMLEAWRTERARRDLHAVRQAADGFPGRGARVRRSAHFQDVEMSPDLPVGKSGDFPTVVGKLGLRWAGRQGFR
jgi:hypothetical protein